MNIVLKQYNENNRTPGTFLEFDASRAVRGLGVILSRALIFGQKTSGGSGNVDELLLVSSLDQAKELAGEGSQLADIYDYWNANNKTLETSVILLAEGTTAAINTIVVDTGATKSGALSLYIGGRKILVSVQKGDAVNTIASAINAVLLVETDLLFDPTVVTDTVTLTAKNQGEWTTKVDVSVNRFPPERGGNEVLPEGVTLTFAQPTPGAGNIDIATALAAVTDDVFNFILMPLNDDSNLDQLDTFLEDRQDANVQLEGHTFNSFAGTLGQASTYGSTRNSPHSTTMYAGADSPTPEHGWAGAYMGVASKISTNDPALPWQFNKLVGIIPDAPATRLTRSERNILLFDGVATHIVSRSGDAQIERGITNYQTNSLGQPDTSFLDSQTPLTLSFIRQSFLQVIGGKFVDFKIVDDTAVITGGGNVTSPAAIRAEIIGWAQDLLLVGLIEDIEQFKEDLVVQRNVSDPTRVDILLPPNLANALRVLAGVVQFIL